MPLKNNLLPLSQSLIRLGLRIDNTRCLGQVLVIAVVYATTAWFVLNKIPMAKHASPVWPSAGLAVGLLLLWGRSRWLGIFLGALCGNVLNKANLFIAMFLASGTTLGCLMTVTLILRFTGTSYPFKQVSHIVAFSLCTLSTGTILQSLLGVIGITLNGFTVWQNFLPNFYNWWIGDTIGILVYAPLIVAWGRSQPDSKVKSWLHWEVVVASLSLLVVAYFTFIKSQPTEYLLLPPLLWAAFRFGAKIATFGVTLIAIIACITTSYKLGFFYQASLKSNSLLFLQLFLGTISVTTMAVLAIVAENHRAEKSLQQANEELEQRVFDRTRDLQESEAKAKQLVTKAEAANQAKSHFLASMSHELRTPMNAILGFAQVMKHDPSLSLQQQEHLSIISRSGEHLLNLINDVLDISKIEADRLTLDESSFDIIDLIESVAAMFQQRTDDKNLSFSLEIADDVPQGVIADAKKLRQVLINLLGNAIKFTTQGSVVLEVKLGNRGQAIGKPCSQCLCFEIRDTGIGIATHELDKIFDAFVQIQSGKISHEGTGLGLAISRKFAQLMGGEISVSSILGQGSIFKFEIPVSVVPIALIPQKPSHRRVIGLASRAEYRILVVDDHLENRLLLVELMTYLGLEVREATNGQEAFELWQEWQPHLIWMDIKMPVMDGYETIQKIRAEEEGDKTVIIALSAHASQSDCDLAIALGCNDYITKPIREESLYVKMSDYLRLQYIYEQEKEEISPTFSDSELQFLLSQMPSDWLVQLYRASQLCDDEEIAQLIQQIPDKFTALSSALQKVVNNFRFESLVKLIDNTKI
jgi:signal transduction histidine kinase/DNA-binding NarL/FixJ family response regulator